MGTALSPSPSGPRPKMNCRAVLGTSSSWAWCAGAASVAASMPPTAAEAVAPAEDEDVPNTAEAVAPAEDEDVAGAVVTSTGVAAEAGGGSVVAGGGSVVAGGGSVSSGALSRGGTSTIPSFDWANHWTYASGTNP